jgi:hypothetical protein
MVAVSIGGFALIAVLWFGRSRNRSLAVLAIAAMATLSFAILGAPRPVA